jgi:membrane-associated phospholipid phosphatase
MNLTKMAYSEPRPYFVDTEIMPHGCSAEYGNPSGHSLFAAGFLFFLFLDVFESADKKFERTSWQYVVGALTALALTISIGFARLYVGVHSMN